MSNSNEIDDEFNNFLENFESKIITYRDKLPAKSKVFRFDFIRFIKSFATFDITNICFPVFINEPISNIQRVAEAFKDYDIINKAADCNDVVSRLAYLAANRILSCSTTGGARFRKPFNPILGETFEYAEPENKFAIVGEQVSHHPPISVIHVQTDKWETTFDSDSSFSFLFTKLRMNWNKRSITRFKKDQEIYTTDLPDLLIYGILTGYVWTENVGVSTISLIGSKAHATISFNSRDREETVQTITGIIYDHDGEEAGFVEGSYRTEIIFTRKSTKETKILWVAEAPNPKSIDYFGFGNFTIKLNDPLYDTKCPTDSRHRPDMRLFEEGKEIEAESEKKRLEIKQRAHTALIKSGNANYLPRWFTLQEIQGLEGKFYTYSGNYWKSKLNNDFKESPDIF